MFVTCCAEGEVQSRSVHDDPVHLVVESAAVYARADGYQGAEGQVGRVESQAHPATSNAAEATRLLYTGRLRHYHLHHAARLSVPRASDAAHL